MDWPVKTKAEKEAERSRKNEAGSAVKVVSFDDPDKRVPRPDSKRKPKRKSKKADEEEQDEDSVHPHDMSRLMLKAKLDIEKFNLKNSFGKRRRKLQQQLVEELSGNKKKQNSMPLPMRMGLRKKALERHHKGNQRRLKAGLPAKRLPDNLRSAEQKKKKQAPRPAAKHGWWKDDHKGF